MHRGLQFGWARRLPVIVQTEAAECGLACLAMIAFYHGHHLDLASLRRRFGSSLKGITLAQLVAMAGQLGFACRPLKLGLDDLAKLRAPCILHWNLNHFVVLKRVGRSDVTLHDPARGVRKLSIDEVSAHFTGVALELTPSADFKPIAERQIVSLRALTGRIRGLVPALLQIFLLASALEIFALTAPFFLQWALDQVLVSADHDLLALLGIGFGVVTVLNAFVSAARSWAVVWLGTTLHVQWASNLFSHLIRLPLDWFEKRHVGDIVSRFGSIQVIQRTLTSQFIDAFLDGLMSMVTLIVMAFYSMRLTVLVSGLFAAYGLASLSLFGPLRRASEEKIVFAARQESELLESVRGAMLVKLANKQDERLARYANATVATANSDVSIQRLGIAFSVVNHLLFGLGRIALVWLAAAAALRNEFTAGMLVAFIAYADQFTLRASGLIDKWTDFRMLTLHAERVADIALTEPEPRADAVWTGPIPEASIELRNVSFRYAEGESWILRNCSLRIEAGESVAITGPSGYGKSTLAKLALGLLQPTEGEVLFGGIDIRKLGLNTYRQWTGSVMQDDQLFGGTIAENVSFFDPEASLEDIIAACQMAAIHEDIVRMPMGYQSRVGDMGSGLSGGQKQRVVLARALYRRPKLLVLDEATSHLDMERESLVNLAVDALAVTRLIITHRQETADATHRCISLAGNAHS